MFPNHKFGLPLFSVCILTLASVPNCNAGPRQRDKPAAPTVQHTMGIKRTVKGISNFGEVTPNLYRGAQPSAEGIDSLKKMGVDVIVDLRGGGSRLEQAAATKLGMQYISIPSHCPFPKDEPLARFLKVVQANQGKKIFVHCRLGDDRTGMAIAAYRMSEEGWSADEALREMKAFGFSTVHRAICPGLEGYEEAFPKKLKENPAFRELSASPTK